MTLGSDLWLLGDKTRSLRSQNSEIDDSSTFLIHFRGLWRTRGERFQEWGSGDMQPLGLAREEELVSWGYLARSLKLTPVVAAAAWLQCGCVAHWAHQVAA